MHILGHVNLRLKKLSLFALSDPLLLVDTDLEAIVEHISDQVCLRHRAFFDSGDLGHVLRLRRLDVQERHEDADLEHVHELSVESLVRHVVEVHRLVVQDLQLVLPDQE